MPHTKEVMDIQLAAKDDDDNNVDDADNDDH